MNINGRVNIIQPDHNAQFALWDKIACDSKSTEYRDALKGNWQDSKLSLVFFSAENIQLLQNGIRAGVYKMSKGQYVIGPQCTETLKIIMRSTFLSYSANKDTEIQGQILALNKIVLDYCVKQVYGEAKGYLKYLEDASTLCLNNMPRPLQVDVNDKTLSEKIWF
jgi:hypothetical protein|tara:strand:- start:2875 stop:3369 length:495 start_codon:yes stop_codon:yes gene_type:complete